MKLFLLLACVATTALAASRFECRSNRGENIVQFNGRNQDIHFPCKYWALKRQPCGNWRITLSPGNRWIYPKYQLDSIWLGIDNIKTGEFWEGRTTNKIAVKYYNSEGLRDLFNKKDGTVATSRDFVFGRYKAGVYIEDRDRTFRVTYTPWDPNNRKDFPNSDWKFECFDKTVVLNEYPDQLCGGSEKRSVLARLEEEFDMPKRFRQNVVYYDVFTNKETVQTNPKCDNATNIILNKCKTKEQRMLAINNCQEILHSQRHTECVTNYNCDPMDVFNSCILWGCTGSGFDPNETEICHEVAEGIDFCPPFGVSNTNPGNLTARVEAAKCYKDFLTMRTDLE